MKLAIVSLLSALFTLQRVSASNLRRREVSDSRVLQENARIFVRYQGERGHRLARRCANKIVRDKNDDDIVIIEGRGRCVNKLLQDVDILEADFDNEVFALSSSLPGADTSGRTMDELIPWGLEMIQANDLELGDNEVVVCIVDSGIASGHPDFDTDMISGTDTVKFWGPRWEWGVDKSGHGTHVAGTIAALAGNDLGVKGVGNFTLHVTRALGDDGRGYESDIYEAVKQCADVGAKVINLSLGGSYMSTRSSMLYTQIVEENGIIMVAAAGNDGDTRPIYPASHPSVIGVGAVYEWGTRMHSSNRGNQLEFAAPGHNIMSTSISAKSVRTEDFAFPAVGINGVPSGAATGRLVYCDADDNKCKDAKDGGICLMVKDDTEIESMLESCQEGGGAGAILFQANNGEIENWSATGMDIPAVAVTTNIGNKLMDYLDEVVTLGDPEDDDIEYTYTIMSGTSMASPHVAASAALLLSHFGNCTNHQIRYAMATTAENPNGECDQDYGYGIIKTKNAYDWLSENHCDTWDVPQLSRGGCTTI